MKKLSLIMIVIMFIVGCGKKESSSNNIKTIIVFAAASLTEVLSEITELYKTVAPDVTIVYNFDSSGRLQTQIENGAEADLFLSAGQRQMDALETRGFIDTITRKNFLKNSVVLIVPNNSTRNITSFNDVMTDKVRIVALGNSDVPVGQYSQEIFEFLNGWEIVSRKASLGSNVKEVLSHVESGSVDCGVVYSTDAATARNVTIVAHAPDGSHRPVTYPAAILQNSSNKNIAQNFLNFLMTDEAVEIFERIGFEVVK